MMDWRHGLLGSGVGVLALGLAGSLFSAGAQAQGASGVLEEIIVTARRREESLQEVPVSVAAFTAEQLEVAGLEQLEDLNNRVPNFAILGGGAQGEGGEADLVMRAVQGVGVYVDGIWQANNFGLLKSEFIDVERIEVLRGPQGTLYGKNTTGGAINIITARPAEEFGARFGVTLGSFDRQDLKVAVDVPLSDTVRTKFTGTMLNRDGHIEQINLNRRIGDTNRDIFSGDLVWEPNDRFNARFIYRNEAVEENGPGRVLGNLIEDGVPFGQTVIRTQYFTVAGRPILNSNQRAGFPGGSIGEYQSTSEVDTVGTLSDRKSGTIDLNWAIKDNLDFKSLTGYQELNTRLYNDNDSTEILAINDDEYWHHWQFTQEFQLSGGNDRISWLGGAYYWDENFATRELRYTYQEFRNGELDFAPVQFACDVDPGPQPDPRPSEAGNFTSCAGLERPGNADTLDGQETKGWAIYANVDIALTDQLTLTLGYRHQDEDLESWAQDISVPADLSDPGRLYAGIPPDQIWDGAKGTPTGGMGVPPGFAVGLTAQKNFESDTGLVSLQYQATDDIMFYGKYSEGFTAGGASVIFPLGVPTITSFVPEELENFELGLRSDWMDGRLRFNATYFMGDWANIQLAETQRAPDGTPLPGTFTGNAAAAEVSGAELELVALPSDNWLLEATIGLLDTEYTEINASTRDVQVGDVFQQAPELTYALAAQWNGETSNGGSIRARMDYSWTDDFVRVRERDRQVGEPSYGLLGANISYSPPSGDWQVQLFGSNLTDEWYKTSGFTSTGFGFDFATVGRPREYGVRMNFFLD